eukprot:SAG11_NODE_9130_length_940_cov_0.829964_2_plen_91_part_00
MTPFLRGDLKCRCVSRTYFRGEAHWMAPVDITISYIFAVDYLVGFVFSKKESHFAYVNELFRVVDVVRSARPPVRAPCVLVAGMFFRLII